MKNLLRILHIGGGGGSGAAAAVGDQHHRLPRPHNPRPPSPAPSPSPPSSSSSTAAARAAADPGGAEEPDRGAGGGGAAAADFGFFEEEFQVQLALAISASDPEARKDPESLQIDAAKRISLGCPVGSHVTNYSIVNYNERVMDGFYDICGIISNRNIQGNLPSLVDLQAIFTPDGLDYDVVLVNRAVDPALQQLERMAQSIALECRRAGLDPIESGLVQKIADVVVERMGGPVGDADDMLRKWKNRSYDLRVAYKTTVLPLGCLDIGLSHHRALLFKVLADKIGLPCRLVKGSYYTGTDEGAVNLIKIGPDCEYIIDLMGAPGALIPAEVPSIQLHTAAVDILTSTAIADSVKDLCSELDEKLNSCLQQSGGTMGGSGQSNSGPLTTVTSVSTAFADDEHHFAVNSQTANKFKNDPELGRFLPPQDIAPDQSSETKRNLSSTQKKKVKNVSKYVISAAQNPEFAQKLHAVLLESGASPPPDLFSDINPQQGVEDDKKFHQNCSPEGHKRKEESQVGCPLLPMARLNSSAVADCENEKGFFALGTFRNHKSGNLGADNRLADCNYRNIEGPDNAFPLDQPSIIPKAYGEDSHGIPGQRCCLGGMHIGFFEPKGDTCLQKCQASDKGCAGTFLEVENDTQVPSSEESSNSLKPLLGDVAGYEILWEDLQLGERIGLGSFGEVYRGDWNGTEVAVKKFLDQDFSGDALEQFRSEIKIMSRLRHPNVVLFMGAVMRPPNLSILTEFLPRGSLYRLLHRPKVQLDEKKRLKMALDVAKGMNYLHTSHPTIVHRDLKSPNLLVDKNWVVKVCDFGLSRLKHHTFLSSKSTAGTPEWMAPEVLRNEPSNEKCDIYSFGVILWELATMRMPWSGMNPMQVVGAVGFQNRRLDIPKEVDPMAAQVIQDCWHSEPSLRPSFSQLMDPLKQLKRLLAEDLVEGT